MFLFVSHLREIVNRPTFKFAQAGCVAFCVAYFVSIYWEDSAVTLFSHFLQCLLVKNAHAGIQL